MIQQSTHNKHW